MAPRSLFRHLWRLATLLLVVVLTYLTATSLVPFLDRRLPVVPVVFVTYLIIAYVLLPFVLRFWRIVFKPNHIPRYTLTPDGWPADPVNIIILAKNKKHFQETMKKAGWYHEDRHSLRNTLREAYAIVFDKPYLTAPFSHLYLFGRHQDLGFQIPYGKKLSPRNRHHVRFWQLLDKKKHIYWWQRIGHLFSKSHTAWIGAAIDDIHPFGFRWRNLQITHANDSEHTLERDYIIQTLRDHGLVKKVESIKDGEPFKLRSQNIGKTFIADGYITVVTLK